MSRKFPRLLFVASMVAGASVAPILGAHAAATRGIDVANNKFGVNDTADASGVTEASKDDTIEWLVIDGEHTVTPDEPEKWGKDFNGTDKLGANERFRFTFTTPGEYGYYCEYHRAEGMRGVVKVIDPNAPRPPAPTPPPPTNNTTTTTTAGPTTTTRPVVPTTTPPASSAGARPPAPAAPAPTTSTAKGKDNKKPKEEETTTTTAPPPPPPAPIDLPDSAIVPQLPGFGSTDTTVQGGGIEDPGSAPEGEAVALLTSNKGGNGQAKKLLIISGIGLGVLGLGTAGYKYANRSSKYFPA